MKTRHVLSFAASLAICAVLVYVAANFVAKQELPINETNLYASISDTTDDKVNSTTNDTELESTEEFNIYDVNTTFASEEIEEETTTQHVYVKIIHSILENVKNRTKVTTEKVLTTQKDYEYYDYNENENTSSKYDDIFPNSSVKVEHAVTTTFTPNKALSNPSEKYPNSIEDELNYNSTESYEDMLFVENTSTSPPENLNEKKIHSDVGTLISNGTELHESIVTSTVATKAIAGDYDYNYEEIPDEYDDYYPD